MKFYKIVSTYNINSTINDTVSCYLAPGDNLEQHIVQLFLNHPRVGEFVVFKDGILDSDVFRSFRRELIARDNLTGEIKEFSRGKIYG